MRRALCSSVATVGLLALLAGLTAAQDDKGAPKEKDKAAPKSATPFQLPEGTKAHRDLAYGAHERQKLDLFLPPDVSGPLPLVLWVHGGGWENGRKEQNPALPFLAKGYAVAATNYRLSQHAVFPAQILDCKNAVRYLRAHAQEYGLDPDRFGVWGASAGGHLVALLGTTGENTFAEETGDTKKASSAVQAVVDWFGP